MSDKTFLEQNLKQRLRENRVISNSLNRTQGALGLLDKDKSEMSKSQTPSALRYYQEPPQTDRPTTGNKDSSQKLRQIQNNYQKQLQIE